MQQFLSMDTLQVNLKVMILEGHGINQFQMKFGKKYLMLIF